MLKHHLVLFHQLERKLLFVKKEKMAGNKRENENETSKIPAGLKKPRKSLIRYVYYNDYMVHSKYILKCS